MFQTTNQYFVPLGPSFQINGTQKTMDVLAVRPSHCRLCKSSSFLRAKAEVKSWLISKNNGV
jgi:hypothetical protein